TDPCPIENYRTHANQTPVSDRAAMQHNSMADGDVFTDKHRMLLLHAVQHAAILNVRIRTDADGMHITANNRIHPHAGMFAEDDAADDLGGVVHITRCRNSRSNALVAADHRALSVQHSVTSDFAGIAETAHTWLNADC